MWQHLTRVKSLVQTLVVLYVTILFTSCSTAIQQMTHSNVIRRHKHACRYKGIFPLQNQTRKVRLNISRVKQTKKISFKLHRVLNVDIIKMDL